MAPVILIGSVTRGREKSAANLFAALTRLVALAAMGMGAEEPDDAPPPPPPEIDAGPRKPARFALEVVKQDSGTIYLTH